MCQVTFIHARSESADDYYFVTPGVLSRSDAQGFIDEKVLGTGDEGYVHLHHVEVFSNG